MTNIEIDRNLALAIGYLPDDVVLLVRKRHTFISVRHGFVWVPFSHQDPSVILPIMERHDCFPHKLANGEWASYFESMPGVAQGAHTNPRTAAALAVIKAKEMGLI